MKGWRAACWTLVLVGIPSAGRADFDQCRLIDQVLNRLGNAMAINRLIIAESSDSSAVAADVTLWPNRTRATGIPNAKAPRPAATAGKWTDWLSDELQASW